MKMSYGNTLTRDAKNSLSLFFPLFFFKYEYSAEEIPFEISNLRHFVVVRDKTRAIFA